MLRRKDRVKKAARQFRQRINKGKRTCGSNTGPNTGSGVRRYWRPWQTGSKERCGSASWTRSMGSEPSGWPGSRCSPTQGPVVPPCGSISVGHFAKDSQKRLLAVKEHLQEGSYVPSAVKRVWIPKAGGDGKRPLGIPTVRDRVVQTALKMVIEPIFEHEFAPHSYGFRPGRGCKDALRRVDGLLKGGLVHVVDVDIKGYFDSIPHGRLLALVKERICDGKVLGLVESMLKQGVMEQMGEVEGTEGDAGTPQGGVISPLLANIYLNPLDWLMSQKGLEMVRYADDMVILCESATKVQEAYEILREWCHRA